jgi:transcriptional regulator with XRE-family HTH domain
MPFYPSSEIHALLGRARVALELTQAELGERFGSSRRTAARWESGQSTPSNTQLHDIVRAVHPVDAKLAAMIAAETGTTLEALGIVRPAPPPLPPLPPPPLPRPFPPIPLLVDSIVLAAMDAFDPTSPDVRSTLRAAFARARGMGLTVEEVDDAFSHSQPPPEAAEPPAKAPAGRKRQT